ncbi:hypothetical protein ADZ36_06125 [Streptomyces fradiae]|uniref:Uncharacterized protein n=2 Tax=Streptomyces TaxID=1883 RepID=A0A3R7EMK6_9ACTN|nr:hypothetical protein ADZ36_06125 [Streptomyces fradiae]OFA37601.1 hypothetical protein BEN35_29005 [Streptomyces fradiae]RKM92463.1 hypothetical protein SFRA_023935 [Streptomyces xinghaiensis]RNC70430.1 hypothetical protein DC095_024925 [Streptomyces xinghaiensis]
MCDHTFQVAADMAGWGQGKSRPVVQVEESGDSRALPRTRRSLPARCGGHWRVRQELHQPVEDFPVQLPDPGIQGFGESEFSGGGEQSISAAPAPKAFTCLQGCLKEIARLGGDSLTQPGPRAGPGHADCLIRHLRFKVRGMVLEADAADGGVFAGEVADALPVAVGVPAFPVGESVIVVCGGHEFDQGPVVQHGAQCPGSGLRLIVEGFGGLAPRKAPAHPQHRCLGLARCRWRGGGSRLRLFLFRCRGGLIGGISFPLGGVGGR